MKRENSFFQPITGMKRYAEEQICNVPLMEIYGHRRVLVENHQGIESYDSNRILVKVKGGCIQICGEALELSRMSKEKVVVTGRINSIVLPVGG